MTRLEALTALLEKVEARVGELEGTMANAERRGPSKPGYVTDYTFYHWGGEVSALRGISRELKALISEDQSQ